MSNSAPSSAEEKKKELWICACTRDPVPVAIKQMESVVQRSNERQWLQTQTVEELNAKLPAEVQMSIIMLMVADKNDLMAVLQFLSASAKKLKSGLMKVIVLNRLDHPKVYETLSKKGASEVIEATTPPRSLMLKVDRFAQILRTNLRKANADSFGQAKGANGTNERKDSAKEEKSQTQWNPPLDIAEDYWLIERKTRDIKVVMGRWLIEMQGPSPSKGSWESVSAKTSVAAGTQRFWKWVPHPPQDAKQPANEFASDRGSWIFFGNEPASLWRENRWRFVGDRISLTFRKGDEELGVRFQSPAAGILEITEQSLQAEKWLPIIAASWEFDMKLRTEKSSVSREKTVLDEEAEAAKEKSLRDSSGNDEETADEWGSKLTEGDRASPAFSDKTGSASAAGGSNGKSGKSGSDLSDTPFHGLDSKNDPSADPQAARDKRSANTDTEEEGGFHPNRPDSAKKANLVARADAGGESGKAKPATDPRSTVEERTAALKSSLGDTDSGTGATKDKKNPSSSSEASKATQSARSSVDDDSGNTPEAKRAELRSTDPKSNDPKRAGVAEGDAKKALPKSAAEKDTATKKADAKSGDTQDIPSRKSTDPAAKLEAEKTPLTLAEIEQEKEKARAAAKERIQKAQNEEKRQAAERAENAARLKDETRAQAEAREKAAQEKAAGKGTSASSAKGKPGAEETAGTTANSQKKKSTYEEDAPVDWDGLDTGRGNKFNSGRGLGQDDAANAKKNSRPADATIEKDRPSEGSVRDGRRSSVESKETPSSKSASSGRPDRASGSAEDLLNSFDDDLPSGHAVRNERDLASEKKPGETPAFGSESAGDGEDGLPASLAGLAIPPLSEEDSQWKTGESAFESMKVELELRPAASKSAKGIPAELLACEDGILQLFIEQAPPPVKSLIEISVKWTRAKGRVEQFAIQAAVEQIEQIPGSPQALITFRPPADGMEKITRIQKSYDERQGEVGQFINLATGRGI